MENKINIAELLKDCPMGMELYSPIFGEVYLDKVRPHLGIVVTTDKYKEEFLYDGRYGINGECMLFPSKGKTTWEGFAPPCQFKEGDIISNDMYIAIFYKADRPYTDFKRDVLYYHCWYNRKYNEFKVETDYGIGHIEGYKLATEEEKEKLFNVIKANGYKWNEETKTLEKLIGPNFHEGDWIACEELNTAKILSINMDRYEVEFIDGNKGFPHIDYIDRNFHLWTIQDAKDGDILAFNDETIVIFKDLYNKTSFHSYCHIEEGIFTISKKDMPDWWEGKGFYPATEEQRTFLFRKIKEAGYKWNAETKTLEKVFELKFQVGDRVQNKNTNMIGTINLIINDEREYQVELENGGITYILFEFQDSWELVPKFKVGDKIVDKSGLCTYIIKSVSDEYYGLKLHHGIGVMPVKHQNDWELVKDNINPKFKVGDRIRKEDNNSMVYTINGVYSSMYGVEERDFGISIEDQDEYELVPNKFDITTLKPFESRVLVRGDIYNFWKPAIFGFIKDKIFYLLGGAAYEQCIPYKNNEHLLGTKNDCDDFYKTWE